jgi:hypothetical protein
MKQAEFNKQLIASLKKPSQWCIKDSSEEGQHLTHRKTGLVVVPEPRAVGESSFSIRISSNTGIQLTRLPFSDYNLVRSCYLKVVALEADARRRDTLRRKEGYLKQFGGFD